MNRPSNHASTDADTFTSSIEGSFRAHIQTLQSRFESVLDDSGHSGIVIHSGTAKTAFLDDQHYPFIPNPHYKNWVPGPHTEDCLVVVRTGKRPLLVFNQSDDYWYKPPSDPTGFWVGEFDIQITRSLVEAHNLIGDPGELIYIGEDVERAESLGMGQINPAQVLDRLHYDRAFKTHYEVACMAEANRIASAGHIAAREAFLAGGSEFEIQHAYLLATGHREQQNPYGAIVALNENAAVLHYQHYEMARLPAGDIKTLLIDAGASCNGYAADITRTYAYKPGRFADLVEAVNQAQQAIVATISVGQNYTNLHMDMQLRLAQILADADIVRMSPGQMVEQNVTFTFMPHGLGHLLGAQTHDVGGYQQTPAGAQQLPPEAHPSLRLTREIAEDMTFTIEPGLYFIPSLLERLKSSPAGQNVNWGLLEELVGYGGIRIEDNIVIEAGKARNLTRPYLP